MSRKYRFGNQDHLHFVTFTTINWIDFFIREEYNKILVNSIKFCQEQKGLEVYAYCFMTSHIHMIIGRNSDYKLEAIVSSLKSFTSNEFHKFLEDPLRNSIESKKELLLWLMERMGKKNNVKSGFQFWQHHNKPCEIWSENVFQQKLNYIHNNPVESGFVFEPEHWKYSSAVNYSGKKGMLDILYT